MARIAAFLMMSLDGYVEDRNRKLGWHHVDEEFHDWSNRQLESSEILLFGRRTYEFMAAAWTAPELQAALPMTARQMNQMPKLVASRHPYTPAWGPAEAIGPDLKAELAARKARGSGEILVLGSNELLSGLVELGLLDELRLMLTPVALGGGTPLLGGLQQPPRLTPLEARPFASGNVLLRFGVSGR